MTAAANDTSDGPSRRNKGAVFRVRSANRRDPDRPLFRGSANGGQGHKLSAPNASRSAVQTASFVPLFSCQSARRPSIVARTDGTSSQWSAPLGFDRLKAPVTVRPPGSQSETCSDQPAPAHFPTTRWSRVLLAGDLDAPLAQEALAELCGAYWCPLYAYIRRRGYDPERARDLTQDFFARALEKGLLAEANPSRGRFRSFLRKVCADFLANRRDWELARKRGGGRAVLSIDPADAERRFALELADGLTPERIFDLGGKLQAMVRREARGPQGDLPRQQDPGAVDKAVRRRPGQATGGDGDRSPRPLLLARHGRPRRGGRLLQQQ
jgi:DNA-directed RNA polymerase specialized sigma24 family protein